MTNPRCTCGRLFYWCGCIDAWDGIQRTFDVWACGEHCPGQVVLERERRTNLSRRTDGENERELEPGDEPRLFSMRGLPTSVANQPRAYRGNYKRKGE